MFNFIMKNIKKINIIKISFKKLYILNYLIFIH